MSFSALNHLPCAHSASNKNGPKGPLLSGVALFPLLLSHDMVTCTYHWVKFQKKISMVGHCST